MSRPCKRCVHLGKSDSCIDIKHKKRGRPKLATVKKWQTAAPSIHSHYHHTFTPMKNPSSIPTTSTSSFKLTQLEYNKEPAKPPLETMTVSVNNIM